MHLASMKVIYQFLIFLQFSEDEHKSHQDTVKRSQIPSQDCNAVSQHVAVQLLIVGKYSEDR